MSNPTLHTALRESRQARACLGRTVRTLTLRRGYARPTRSEPSKITLEGTLARAVDVSAGVDLHVTDGATMDVATFFA